MTRNIRARRITGWMITVCTAAAAITFGPAAAASAVPAAVGALTSTSTSTTTSTGSTQGGSSGADTALATASACTSTPFRSKPKKKVWYRIPSVVQTQKGTLVAFAEARDNNDTSDMGNYDIVTARSTDGGCSWSTPKVIGDDAANRVANASAVVDSATGTILVLSNVTARPNSGGSGSGLYLQTSTDDGRSFTPLLAQRVDTGNLKAGMPGPASGIQLTRSHAGRIIWPIVYRTGAALYGAYGLYTDDHGQSWNVGYHQTDLTGDRNWIEGTIAEMSDGDLYVSYRARRTGAATGTGRDWAVSKDGGQSLAGQLHRSSLPIVSVQGSALSPTGKYDDTLLFSAPADTNRNRRRDMSLFVSTDGGNTWDSRYQLVLHSQPAAYSALVQMGGLVGVLYETGVDGWKERIDFRSVRLSAVVNPTKIRSTMTYYRADSPVSTQEQARARVQVNVPGTSSPQGTVTLIATSRSGDREKGVVSLGNAHRGRRWVALPKLRRGTYDLTLHYSGTARVKSAKIDAGRLRVTLS